MRKAWENSSIAQLAEDLRKFLGIPLWMRIDVKALILKFEHHSDERKRIRFVEMPAGYLKGFSAKARPKDRTIFYKAGLMDQAIAGVASAIAIFIEEMGHCFLHKTVDSIDHAEGADSRAANFFEFQEMEEEARKFVFYTFAPVSEVYSVTDPSFLIEKFGMPADLATEYVEHLKETRREIEKLPASDNVVRYRKSRRPEKKSLVKKTRGVEPKPWLFTAPANANMATAIHNPFAGFLDEICDSCSNKTMRNIGGCKQCLCGQSNGCDD